MRKLLYSVEASLRSSSVATDTYEIILYGSFFSRLSSNFQETNSGVIGALRWRTTDSTESDESVCISRMRRSSGRRWPIMPLALSSLSPRRSNRKPSASSRTSCGKDWSMDGSSMSM